VRPLPSGAPAAGNLRPSDSGAPRSTSRKMTRRINLDSPRRGEYTASSSLNRWPGLRLRSLRTSLPVVFITYTSAVGPRFKVAGAQGSSTPRYTCVPCLAETGFLFGTLPHDMLPSRP
jgi:hypothetical protein